MWNDKRYHTLDYEFKKTFGEKAIKLSIDGGFTCPNRDGTIGKKGCIFCSERGSGEFTSDKHKSISEQITEQKQIMSKKWISNTYIAYFQNYTTDQTSYNLSVLSNGYKHELIDCHIPDLSVFEKNLSFNIFTTILMAFLLFAL